EMGEIEMKRLAIKLLPLALSVSGLLASVCGPNAFAAETTSTVTVTDEKTEIVPRSSDVVLDLHTGSHIPQTINLAVGQRLLFKSNNLVDALTLQYHDVSMYYAPDGKDALRDTTAKGYRAAFRAVAPGQTKLSLDHNTMFYGLAPWGSRDVLVNVVPTDAAVTVAGVTSSQQ
ncbi:MAG TPA: hypothetical protein V6C72_03120, partial [Chroococcales cyanobacterium]